MSRYKNTEIRTKHEGGKSKSYYSTTYIPGNILKDSDLYFIAQEGDRCDNLAQKFYGDPKKWWMIARANYLTSINIPAGMSLRIPR